MSNQFTVEYDDNPSDAVDSIREILETNHGLTIVNLNPEDFDSPDITYEIRRNVEDV